MKQVCGMNRCERQDRWGTGQVGRDRCGDGTGVRFGGREGRRGGVCRACLDSGHSGQGWDPGKLPWVPGEALERAVLGGEHDA